MKTKRILSLLASLAMAVTAVTGAMSVSAEEIVERGECGEKVTWTLDADGVLTISGEGKMASPEFDKENSTDTFEDFYTYKKYKDNIKEVKIEEGVTSIGLRAFYAFPNIETVSIPSTITEFTLGDYNSSLFSDAFEDCESLVNLTLAEGLTCIGNQAFKGCTSLETVDIPSTITEWGEYSFDGCTSLKNITLHDGITTIGGGAFLGTAVESIYIPSTIENWGHTNDYSGNGHGAFQNCKNLKSITFGDGLKVLGHSYSGNIFNGCTSLEEIAFGDDSQLTYMSFSVFGNCTSLKRVEIPDNVTSIADVFTSVDSIQTVYLYSRTLDAYNLPENARILCYGDAVAKSQITCSGIEDEISKTLKELKTAVKEAGKYSEKDYTAESYGTLKALLEQAETKDKESHILGMERLTEDIYSAIEGLEEKKDEPSTPSDPSDPTDPSESDPTDPSDSSDPTSPSKPTSPTNPTGGNVKKTTSPAQKASQAKAAAEKAIKQAKITSLTAKAKGKKINVTWKKAAKATGYEVQASTKKNFNKNVIKKTTTKNKLVIKKLKSKKKYFVRVRAYKTYKDAKGKTQKVYGKWFKSKKKVKVK